MTKAKTGMIKIQIITEIMMNDKLEVFVTQFVRFRSWALQSELLILLSCKQSSSFGFLSESTINVAFFCANRSVLHKEMLKLLASHSIHVALKDFFSLIIVEKTNDVRMPVFDVPMGHSKADLFCHFINKLLIEN